ncbi:MAG: YjbQ family protein [Flavobacteriaceae bacterium]|nr:MAG: YjbQ family protein [Flavobacteriaceae bacterium]
MIIQQKEIVLPSYKRGIHLITNAVLQEIPEIESVAMGMLQVFIKHTSASLTINENADPTVRVDFENHLNVLVPENAPYYKHTYEGPDDMPAHIKASLLGTSLQIPVTNGSLNLGVWQGIYLCEHRDNARGRKLLLSIWGV